MQNKNLTVKEKRTLWLASPKVDDATKAELCSLGEKEIEDRFWRDLSFGTGGLRGIMGAGTNRMNLYTVSRATEGVAKELLNESEENATRGVVIAYDSRNNSAKFALKCAEVLSAFGIRAYLFDRLCPTPELSFAVRHLGCCRGIVITASHNPKEYNGYKVYDADGTQIPPEVADRVLGYIREADAFDAANLPALPKNIISVGEEVHASYIGNVKKQSTGIDVPEDFAVLYTPLHGAGKIPVCRILRDVGVKKLTVVKEQEEPSGDFPTVKSPNPEERSAFDLAIEYAKKDKYDIIIGTDPDSDRLGVVVPERDGSFTVLNGNQTGALLADFVLRKTKERGMPPCPKVVKTIVTTELVRKIASAHGAETEDVLTGFKYIGDKIKEYEKRGESYIFGLEESYGYLKGTYARDKDAVVAAMLATELAAECKARGITLTERLGELYEAYGYHKEKLMSYTLYGIEGAKKISVLMKKFRSTPTLDKEVRRIDYSSGVDGLPPSDVLKFFFDDGWLAIRPSGTEPKIKIYAASEGKTDAEAEKNLARLTAWAEAAVKSVE